MLSCRPNLSPLYMLIYQPCRGHRFLMKSAHSRYFPRLSLAALFVVLFAFAISWAQRPSRRPNNRDENAAARPRLVLLIVVDQFRFDYLTRYGDLFGEKGIGRLLR